MPLESKQTITILPLFYVCEAIFNWLLAPGNLLDWRFCGVPLRPMRLNGWGPARVLGKKTVVKDRDIKSLCWRLTHCEQLFPRPAIIWPWGKEKPRGSRLIRQHLWLSACTCNRKTSAALVLKENMWSSPGLIALRLPCDSLDRGLRGACVSVRP